MNAGMKEGRIQEEEKNTGWWNEEMKRIKGPVFIRPACPPALGACRDNSAWVGRYNTRQFSVHNLFPEFVPGWIVVIDCRKDQLITGEIHYHYIPTPGIIGNDYADRFILGAQEVFAMTETANTLVN